jgi:vacuolar-type H+-ATPase subunit E/Vma4
MGVDTLIARLEQDAQARIAALQAGADAEIAAIDRECAQGAAMDQSQVLAARRAERQAAFAVEHARARQQAAAQVLAAEYAFVDRVFARAQALAATAGVRFVEALPRYIEALAGHLGGQAATLRCRPELAEALQRCAGDLGDVTIATDEAMPVGFVAATGDGRCTIDCTLPARLSALRPRLRAALLSRVPP